MLIVLGNEQNPFLKEVLKLLEGKGVPCLHANHFRQISFATEMDENQNIVDSQFLVKGFDCSHGHVVLNWIDHSFFDDVDGEFCIMEQSSSIWSALSYSKNVVINQAASHGFSHCLNSLPSARFANMPLTMRIPLLAQATHFASAEKNEHLPRANGQIKETFIVGEKSFGAALPPLLDRSIKDLLKDIQVSVALVYSIQEEEAIFPLGIYKNFNAVPESDCLEKIIELLQGRVS